LPVAAAVDTVANVGSSRAALSAHARRARHRAARLVPATGAAIMWLATAPARAEGESPDDSRAIAEALFRSGRELMAAGDLARACEKFAESQRIDPKPGTLMNLALCHEKVGRTASAWAEYVQAAEVAHRAGQDERERVAHERALALETTMPHLVVDSAAGPSATVTLDGHPIGGAAFGTAIPVDPGEHVVAANAPGKDSFRESITVAPVPNPVTVHIPVLSAVVPGPLALSQASGNALRPGPTDDDGRSGFRTAGFISSGAGIALIGVGSYFGARAFMEKASAENACDATRCTQSGLDAIGAMKTAEAVSTISIAAGVLGVGVGIYFLLVPSRRATARAGGTSSTGTLEVGLDASTGGVRTAWTW